MNEVLKIFTACDNLPMYAQLSGISYCDGSYHTYRKKSDITVIEYVTDGEGYVTVDGKDCPVTKNMIYILQKGCEHNYYSCSENPWRKVFINLAGDLPVSLLREYNLASECLFDGTGLKYLFERIEKIVNGDSSDAQCQAELSAIYLEVLSRLSQSHNNAAHSTEAQLLKTYLDDNMDKIINNSTLAAHIYRSPDYCVKLFNREYGVTPYNYQLSEKMSISRRLLRNTSMPISAVAAAVGYGDARYFSGLFKQKCGLSPAQYRKKQKQSL